MDKYTCMYICFIYLLQMKKEAMIQKQHKDVEQMLEKQVCSDI